MNGALNGQSPLRLLCRGLAIALAGVALWVAATHNAQAAVSVTAATGGTNLTADRAGNASSPQYTTLGAITFAEPSGPSGRCQMDNYALGGTRTRTLIIKAPTGWIFDTSFNTVTFTGGRDITATSVTGFTTKTFTLTITFNSCNATDTLNVTLAVRAVDGGCLSSQGNLYIDAASTLLLTGVTKGASPPGQNLGTLSQVVGSLNRLVVTLPGQTFVDNDSNVSDGPPACTPASGSTGSPTTQTAGTSFGTGADYRIRAADQFFNVVTTYTGVHPITYLTPPPNNAPNGQAPVFSPASGGNVSFAAGVSTTTLTATLYAAETATITARDIPSSVQGTSSSVTVQPGPKNNFLVEQSGGGSIGGQSQNVAFNIRVTARDQWNNVLSSGTNAFNTTATLTSSCTLSGTPVTSGTFTNGVLDPQSVTVTGTGATCTITADSAPATGTSNTFAVAAAVSSFDAFEDDQPGGSTSGPLYTKIVGAAFPLGIRVIAKTAGGAIAAGFSGNVKVEVVDATGCPSSTVIQTISPITLTSGVATGGAAPAFAAVATAWASAKIKISYPTTSPTITSCSADTFVIRPTGFTVASNMTNSGSSGAPAIAAGTSFTLTATALANYSGTPKIDATKVVAHAGAIQAGTLAGTFGAANPATGVATGAAFTYSEVGNFQLNANGVYDDTFTTSDNPGNCNAGSFSNTAASGKYGCNFGSATSAYFGRFYPAYFFLDTQDANAPLLTDRSDFAACYPVTTGSISSSSSSLTVSAVSGLNIGDIIVVKGAGAGGSDLVTTINNIVGLTFTLADSASTTVSGSPVRRYGFTYMDEPFKIAFRLTAYNTGGAAVTKNYDGGTYAKLLTNTPIPASFGFAATTGGTDRSSRLSGALGITGSWSQGILSATATLVATRDTAPDGPFTNFDVGIWPADSDSVTLQNGQKNLDVDGVGGNDHAKLGRTDILFGQLRMLSALGSQALDLSIPLDVQNWNGLAWQLNTGDSCTSLPAASFALGNYYGLTTTNMPAANLPATATLIANGTATLTLKHPTDSPPSTGRVDVTVNLGNTTSPSVCGGFTTPQPANPAGAGMSYLRGEWCAGGSVWDPVARATFGLTGSKFINLRENY